MYMVDGFPPDTTFNLGSPKPNESGEGWANREVPE